MEEAGSRDELEQCGPLRLVFYTPDAEMAESDPHVSALTPCSRAARRVSHVFNKINSKYTSLAVKWVRNENSSSGGVFYKKNAPPSGADPMSVCGLYWGYFLGSGDLGSEGEGREGEEVWSETEYSDEGLVLTSRFFDARGERRLEDAESVIPSYCHAELCLGVQTYSIRWGDLLYRQTRKTYSTSANLLSWLSLNLAPEAIGAAHKFCERCIEEVDGFNYAGIYLNFAPSCLKEILLENGVSHRPNKNVVFCSEFVARVLCTVGVLEDATGEFPAVEGIVSPMWEMEHGEPTNESSNGCVTIDADLAGPLRTMGISVRNGTIVEVAPALMSPNSLYLALRIKMQACQELGLLTRSTEAWSPFIGPWQHCVNCLPLPTMS